MKVLKKVVTIAFASMLILPMVVSIDIKAMEIGMLCFLAKFLLMW